MRLATRSTMNDTHTQAVADRSTSFPLAVRGDRSRRPDQCRRPGQERGRSHRDGGKRARLLDLVRGAAIRVRVGPQSAITLAVEGFSVLAAVNGFVLPMLGIHFL